MFKKKRAMHIAKKTEETHLNEISQRHLDYYNENIKSLEKDSESPEETHKLFKDSKSQKKTKKAQKI